MEPLLRRIWLGARIGLAFGVVYSAWVLLLLLVNGPGYFQAEGINLPLLIGAYLVAGVLAGSLVGMARPAVRNWFGAAIVGYLIALPVIHLIMMTDAATDPFSADALRVTAVTAALEGPAGGIIIWSIFRRKLK